MRYKSKLRDGLQVYAVAGTNTVSFGIRADQAARSGLLGFAIERIDPAKNEHYYIHGFKVFPSIVPQPNQTGPGCASSSVGRARMLSQHVSERDVRLPGLVDGARPTGRLSRKARDLNSAANRDQFRLPLAT